MIKTCLLPLVFDFYSSHYFLFFPSYKQLEQCSTSVFTTTINAIMRSTLFYSVLASGITSVLSDASISTFANSLTLSASFDPIKPAYWTGLPHHRRTPFSVSPDGKS